MHQSRTKSKSKSICTIIERRLKSGKRKFRCKQCRKEIPADEVRMHMDDHWFKVMGKDFVLIGRIAIPREAFVKGTLYNP